MPSLNPFAIFRSSLTYFEKVGEETSEALLENDVPIIHRQRRSLIKTPYPFLIHVAILILYTTITLLVIKYDQTPASSKLCNTLITSPAHDAVLYERVSFNNSLEDKNPFKGTPRDELHDAWRSILQYQNIRVQEEDLRRINRTGIPLNDEKGGYLATLDVFHELHCLNVIREQVYRPYYPDKHTEELQLLHVDHCIDTLRQTLMCHGDISLLTHTFIPDYRWPWPNFAVDHECRNWDALMEWSKERWIPSLRGPIVTHPTLGVSWRGDEEQ